MSSVADSSWSPHNVRPHPHYTRAIWKRCFHFKHIKYFPSARRRRNLKTQQHNNCVWGKLREGYHMIIVTSPFSKSSVFKIFSIHTKMQSRRFQIPPVWRAFAKTALFSWRISVDGRPKRRNKTAFSNFSGVVVDGT